MQSQPPKSPLSGGLWQLRASVNVHLFLEVIIVVLEDSGKEQKLCNWQIKQRL